MTILDLSSREAPGVVPRVLPTFLLAMVCLWGGSASAASQSDEDACRPDVFRLCASAIPDETAIVACLNAKLQNLSPACRAVMAPAGATPPVPASRRRRTAQRCGPAPAPAGSPEPAGT